MGLNLGRRAVLAGMGIGDGFGQVLPEVADGPVGVLGRGDDAGHVDLAAEPHHVRRLRTRVGGELVEGFLPGGQNPPRCQRRRRTRRPKRERVGRRRAGRRRATTAAGRWRRRPGGSWPAGSPPGSRRAGAAPTGAAVQRRRSTAPCSPPRGAGSATTGRRATCPTPAAGSCSEPDQPARRCY